MKKLQKEVKEKATMEAHNKLDSKVQVFWCCVSSLGYQCVTRCYKHSYLALFVL